MVSANPVQAIADGASIVWEKWQGLTPEALSYTLLVWIYIRFSIYILVCALQCRVDYRPAGVPPELRNHITPERFNRGRGYRLAKTVFQLCTFVYILAIIHVLFVRKSALFRLWLICQSIFDRSFIYIWPDYWDTEILLTIIFVVLGVPFLNGLDLPIQICDTFYIEQSYGFNRQTVGFFIMDKITKNVIEICVLVPVCTGILIITKFGGNFFFLWLWFFTFICSAFVVGVYPMWIAPYFDTYVPLPEGRLKTRLQNLARRCDFPVDEILILKESHRTTHSRAFFFGLGRMKRIVLSDNLLRNYLSINPAEDSAIHLITSRMDFQAINPTIGCTEEEIEALVAHEIAHWKQGHIIWDLILGLGTLFIQFLCFWWLHTESKLYEAFEFPQKSKKPILIGLFIIYNHILDTVNYIIDLFLKWFSRKCEYNADAFTVRLGYGQQLKEAIAKVHMDNLTYPYFNYFYSFFFHTSPPVLKRLRAIDVEMRKLQ